MSKLDTKKVLKEIDKHTRRFKKILGEDRDFQVQHEEVLNLCKLIIDRKSEYKEINIEYPNETIVIIKSYLKRPDLEIPNKETRRSSRQKLATGILEILKKQRGMYSLKAQIEK